MDEMHWITVDPFDSDLFEKNEDNAIRIAFKTRHTPEFFDGILYHTYDNRYVIESDREVQGIAPGQYSIIYTSDCKICLGSGMISKS